MDGDPKQPLQPSPQQHRHVCVLQNNEGQDEGTQAIISQQVAESLSLPLLTPSQLLEAAASSALNDDETTFTHALCVLEYQEGQSWLERQDQYVVAIQPLLPTAKKRAKKLTQLFSTSKPYWIDFCPPQLPPRQSGQQPDLLLQAVAPQRVFSSRQKQETNSTEEEASSSPVLIYDLTAGWGQDSVLMAQSCDYTSNSKVVCQVHMVERDPIVACLLQDALRRVECISKVTTVSNKSSWQQRAQRLNQQLSLQVGDARTVLFKLKEDTTLPRPDIIYLDPMFPPRTKTAAVKKGMQILHGLFLVEDSASSSSDDIGNTQQRREAEEEELLQLAHQVAQVKVVVKRPINAPLLGGDESTTLKPSNVVKGSINRWDIYVK